MSVVCVNKFFVGLIIYSIFWFSQVLPCWPRLTPRHRLRSGFSSSYKIRQIGSLQGPGSLGAFFQARSKVLNEAVGTKQGTRAPESEGRTTLAIPAHAFEAGKRPVPEPNL